MKKNKTTKKTIFKSFTVLLDLIKIVLLRFSMPSIAVRVSVYVTVLHLYQVDLIFAIFTNTA